jgi:hypothetical protein
MSFQVGQRVYCIEGSFLLPIGEMFTIKEVHSAGAHVRVEETTSRWWDKNRFSATPWWKVGDVAQIKPKQGSELPTGSISKVRKVHESLPKVKLEDFPMWISTNRLYKTSALGESVEELSPAPTSPAPKKTVVLNEKAKKVKLPSAHYKQNVALFWNTPFWTYINDKIPDAHRERIYQELKGVLVDPDVQNINVHTKYLSSAFAWAQTTQGADYWQIVSQAIDTNNWQRYEQHYCS